MANPLLSVMIFFTVFSRGLGWSQDELDIFDLVEEIGQNFYDILQVQKDCSSADIRRAYRRTSLQYHPDKNDDPNAADQFTKINAVAEVLKDEQKRAMYDSVLENGLPDWKQPVYYYRRVRKMGMAELMILLITVLTVGQYLFGWAAYLEKQIVLYELRSKRDEKVRKSKGKKSHQQLETEVAYYEFVAQSYVPSLRRLLPFAIIIGVYRLSKAVANGSYEYLRSYKTKGDKDKEKQLLLEQEEREREVREKEEERERVWLKEEEEKARIKAEKKLRKLEQSLKAAKLQNEGREVENKRIVETRTDMETRLKEIELEYEEEDNNKTKVSKGNKKRKKGKKIADLSETITATDRHQDDEGHLDDDTDTVTSSDRNETSELSCDSMMIEDSGWSQYQQKQLEWALSHYTKDIEDRWEKVSMAVPGKSKNDCLVRYKELVKLVQTRTKKE